jgi:hypothetical protein
MIYKKGRYYMVKFTLSVQERSAAQGNHCRKEEFDVNF